MDKIAFKRVRPNAPPIETWIYNADDPSSLAHRFHFGLWTHPVGMAVAQSAFRPLSSGEITGDVLRAAVARGEAQEIDYSVWNDEWNVSLVEWAVMLNEGDFQRNAPIGRGDEVMTRFKEIERTLVMAQWRCPGGAGHFTVETIDALVPYDEHLYRGVRSSQQFQSRSAARKHFTEQKDRLRADARASGTNFHVDSGAGKLDFTAISAMFAKHHDAKFEAEEKIRREAEARAQRDAAERARIAALRGTTGAMSDEEFAKFMREQRAKKQRDEKFKDYVAVPASEFATYDPTKPIKVDPWADQHWNKGKAR